jgi:hypothetical protein
MSLQGGLGIERMCPLVGVSRAGFYRYLRANQPPIIILSVLAELGKEAIALPQARLDGGGEPRLLRLQRKNLQRSPDALAKEWGGVLQHSVHATGTTPRSQVLHFPCPLQ